MNLSLGRSKLVLIGLYIWLSLMLCLLHGHEINLGNHQFGRSVRHSEILTGQGRAPYAYRILQPSLVEATQPLVRRAFA